MTAETVEALGMGFAPDSGGLRQRLMKEGFAEPLLLKSGLLVQRDEGQARDRFRNRLMIPICRDSGSIIAFGGRAMRADQQPKYLNSPETAIYVKGRTLYGLHLGKPSISRLKYAVLVEGYFDWAQAWQAGITNVVASSGTALTPAQARLLRRFAGKVVLSFDPDAAGQGAAARSSELLVTEGFQVNVAMLPAGDDPDNYIRKRGAAAYQELLRNSRQYLEYLLDRSASEEDLSTDEGRRSFLGKMLAVAARIPDAAQRDQFADRLSHKARITEEVVRAEIRKAAVQRQTSVEEVQRRVPNLGQVKVAERGLIWALMHEPGAATAALVELDPADLDGLATREILRQAQSLQEWPAESLPQALIERLSTAEAALVQEDRRQAGAPADAADCVRTLKALRYDRERADVQREIDRLQEAGRPGTTAKSSRSGNEKRSASAASETARALILEDGVVDRRKIRRSKAAHLHRQGEGLPAVRRRSTSCCPLTSRHRTSSMTFSARSAAPASRSSTPRRPTAREAARPDR
jgi:DNA primase